MRDFLVHWVLNAFLLGLYVPKCKQRGHMVNLVKLSTYGEDTKVLCCKNEKACKQNQNADKS